MTQEFINIPYGLKAPINLVLHNYGLRTPEFRYALNVASMERLRGLLEGAPSKALSGKTRRAVVERRLKYLERVNATMTNGAKP